MPMQKVEFTFPDEDDDKIDVEPSSAKTMGEEGFDKPDEEEEVVVEEGEEEDDSSNDDSDEIEVVDDTPEEDRGREPSEPPEDITEEELEKYSKNVRKRIQHFAKGYHDERRAKEQATREREELERVAKQLYEENQRLKGTASKSQEALLAQAKKVVESELAAAKRNYREAYEKGDADAILEAQEALTTAQYRSERLKNIKPESLQAPKDDTDFKPDAAKRPEVSQQPTSQADPKAQAWAEKNQWFGTNEAMTGFALGYHNELVKSGINPRSEEYYEKLNSRMREVFPEQFGGDKGERKPKKQVVAPATRSRAPKKITLTKSQVAIAKRMGVPLEEYAKELAKEMRKAKNG